MALDPHLPKPVEARQVTDGVMFETVVSFDMLNSGELLFPITDLTQTKYGGLQKAKWFREHLALESGSHHKLPVLGHELISVLSLKGGTWVRLAGVVQALDLQVFDIVSLEVVVLDGLPAACEIGIKRHEDSSFTAEVAALPEVAPSLGNPYWYVLTTFVAQVVQQSMQASRSGNPEDLLGGVEIVGGNTCPSESDSPINLYVNWYYSQGEEMTLYAVGNPSASPELLPDDLAVLSGLGWTQFPNQPETWHRKISGANLHGRVAEAVVEVFRDVYRVTPNHQWHFSPERFAANVAFARQLNPRDDVSPSQRQELALDIRSQFAEGFSLPGPITVPLWLAPWVSESL